MRCWGMELSLDGESPSDNRADCVPKTDQKKITARYNGCGFIGRLASFRIGHWSLVIGHWSLVAGISFLPGRRSQLDHPTPLPHCLNGACRDGRADSGVTRLPMDSCAIQRWHGRTPVGTWARVPPSSPEYTTGGATDSSLRGHLAERESTTARESRRRHMPAKWCQWEFDRGMFGARNGIRKWLRTTV